MKKMKIFSTVSVLSLACSLFANTASAQSFDYGSFEQMFGEPVTTSATGSPQRVSDVPVNMTIITSEEIKRSGETTIPRILNRVAGVNVIEWGTGSQDVSVRGYNQGFSPRLLVMVNGRQVYMDQYGMTSWSSIPVQLSEIRQIEVVKGPNAALFGFNAVAGVVNIITYNPLYDNKNVVTANLGTQNYKELNGVTTIKPNDKVGVRVSGSGFGSNEFDDNRLTFTEANYRVNPKGAKANMDMLAQIHEGGQLGTEFSYSENRLNEYYPSASMVKADYQTHSAKANYALESKAGLTEASVYRNTMVVTYDEDRLGDGKLENNVLVAKLQHLIKPAANHALRFATEYRENDMNSVPLNIGVIKYAVGSYGAMWDWGVTSKISLMNALRFDHLELERTGTAAGLYDNEDYDRTIDKLNYNSSAVYKATQEDTFRLAAARGYQLPSLIELGFLRALGGPFYVTGNPYLKPTEVTNQELSYERKVKEINGDVKLSVFHQESNDIKSSPSVLDAQAGLGFGTAGAGMEWKNIGRSKSWGGELEVQSQVTPELKLTGAYIVQTIHDKFTVNSTALYYPVDFENSTPKNSLKVGASYTKGKYEGDVFATWQQSYKMLRSTGSTAVASFALWNVPAHLNMTVRAGYNIDETTNLSLTGMNVTSSDQVVSSGPEVERRFIISLKKEF